MSDPPTSIRALQAEQVLEVTWPESRVDRFPYLTLRSECPCATCRNEWTGERILDPQSIRPDLKLVGMENIQGGTDCGIGSRVGHPEVVWAKLSAMAEGAAIATKKLKG